MCLTYSAHLLICVFLIFICCALFTSAGSMACRASACARIAFSSLQIEHNLMRRKHFNWCITIFLLFSTTKLYTHFCCWVGRTHEARSTFFMQIVAYFHSSTDPICAICYCLPIFILDQPGQRFCFSFRLESDWYGALMTPCAKRKTEKIRNAKMNNKRETEFNPTLFAHACSTSNSVRTHITHKRQTNLRNRKRRKKAIMILVGKNATWKNSNFF